jgi:hypothetical protein
MKADLLLDVVEVLKDVPDDKFDINTFAERRTCGTVGCAIGHWCMARPDDPLQISDIDDAGALISLNDDGIELDGFRAVEERFRLNNLAAHFLFNGAHYGSDYLPTRENVMKRITDFVDGKVRP